MKENLDLMLTKIKKSKIQNTLETRYKLSFKQLLDPI